MALRRTIRNIESRFGIHLCIRASLLPDAGITAPALLIFGSRGSGFSGSGVSTKSPCSRDHFEFSFPPNER